MELWIRSQNKEKLCKIENIKYMDTSDDFENDTHSLWNDNNGILGIYKTKQRALEVLDEIQNTILGIISSEDIEEQNVKKYTGISTLSNITHCLLYEMPKE